MRERLTRPASNEAWLFDHPQVPANGPDGGLAFPQIARLAAGMVQLTQGALQGDCGPVGGWGGGF